MKGIEKILVIAAFLLAISPALKSQTNCLTAPPDSTIDCGEVNWGFIYNNTDGAYVHPCDNPSIDLDSPIDLLVIVDTLSCGDPASPNVVLRISRTFTAYSAEVVDFGCGFGLICATQTIDVVDFEPPAFSEFPADTIMSCENWNLLDYLISGVFEVDFYDNCSLVEQTINLDTTAGSCLAESEFYWEFSLIDGCNNTLVDTHIVSIVDTIGPEITFLPPQILAIPFECKDLVVWPIASATDLCSEPGDVSWGVVEEDSLSCPNHWLLSRWAYATDDCGNLDSALYEIEVHDTTPPDITYVPLGFSISCEEPPLLENAFAIDGCLGPVDMVVETDTIFGSCPQNYTIHRTFTATDNCDNSATANQLIVVADLTAPELTIPENYLIECDEALILDNATATDNCDSNPLVEAIDEVVNVQSTGTYSLLRNFTVTDACGNSTTAQQTIDVSDTNPPFFTLFPEDLVLTCGEDYPEEAVLFEDLCDPSPILVEVSTVEDIQDCANATTIFRTYVIEDDAGNSHYSTQIITFVDDEPPFFTSVPEDYITDCANNIGLDFPLYDDLCSAQGMTLDVETTVENELCEDHFDLARVFTITDACGLSAETTQTISVRDVTPPLLITELDSLFFHCATDVPSCEAMILDLEFQDECSSSEFFTFCDDVVLEGDCELQECVWERSYYWEDGCGNQDSTSHFIRVNESVFVPTLPTGMTPNSDGYNDAYVILDIGPLIAPGELAPCNWVDNTLFRVVNRWGAIVFEEENYRNDWEGTNQNGEALPAGTYYVVFEANGVAYATYVDLRR